MIQVILERDTTKKPPAVHAPTAGGFFAGDE